MRISSYVTWAGVSDPQKTQFAQSTFRPQDEDVCAYEDDDGLVFSFDVEAESLAVAVLESKKEVEAFMLSLNADGYVSDVHVTTDTHYLNNEYERETE